MTTETIAQKIAAEAAFETAQANAKAPGTNGAPSADVAMKAQGGVKMTKAQLFELTPITMLPISNPKKVGTMSYDRFQGYFTPGIETVGDAFAAGLRMDDIRHDSNKGFIMLGETPA